MDRRLKRKWETEMKRARIAEMQTINSNLWFTARKLRSLAAARQGERRAKGQAVGGKSEAVRGERNGFGSGPRSVSPAACFQSV